MDATKRKFWLSELEVFHRITNVAGPKEQADAAAAAASLIGKLLQFPPDWTTEEAARTVRAEFEIPDDHHSHALALDWLWHALKDGTIEGGEDFDRGVSFFLCRLIHERLP